MNISTDEGTTGLSALSAQQCLRLLRGHPLSVGRLGVTDDEGQPLIFPVNYRLDGDAVVVRTSPETVLARWAVDRRVAFEVDDVDAAWQEGWSVLVQGIAERIDDVVELARLKRVPLRPWAPGTRPSTCGSTRRRPPVAR